jgi:MFS family permease
MARTTSEHPVADLAVDLSRNVRWLYAGRALRGFSTAFLTVVFPLYLATVGFNSVKVGAVFTVGSLVSAALVVFAGLSGDHFGRKKVLIALGLLGAAGILALAESSNLALIMVASGFGGVGRGGGAGSGGAWGPVFPVEQPLLAGSVSHERRTHVFGRISFVGVLAQAAGSLVAFLPTELHRAGWSLVSAYHLVFLIGAGFSLLLALVSLPIKEIRIPVDPTGTKNPAPQRPGGLSTKQLIGRLGLTNLLNGFGFGFLAGLLTYWFHVRYGVGPGEIGILYTVANLAAALPYLGAARITRRLGGAVLTVTITRAVSVGLLVALAVMPSFWLAALMFTLRTVVFSLGLPARQSYIMGVADESRRGTVAAMGSLPSQLSATVSPVIGGVLMESLLAAPLFAAAFFIAANTVAYYFAFRHAPPPEEQKSRGTVARVPRAS